MEKAQIGKLGWNIECGRLKIRIEKRAVRKNKPNLQLVELA